MKRQLHPWKIAKATLTASAVLMAGCSAEVSDTESNLNQNNAQQTESFGLLQPLIDFNSDDLPSGLETDGASVTLVSADNSEDGNALKVDFSADTHLASVRIRPEQPWDWSAESDFQIAIDATNPGSESIQVYLSLTDGRSKLIDGKVTGHRAVTANRAVNLAPGESGTYFAVLDGPSANVNAGIRENPVPWQTDDEMFVWRYGEKDINLGEITEIGFFVRGNLSDKSVVIDNIRLRRNPEYDPSYLENIVDQFGQNAKQDYPIKVHSVEELKQAAEKELASLSGLMPDRSRFGGWKNGPRFEATGYFSTKKVNDKWWMVDPDGYLFFSHGLANVRMANLTTLTGVDFKDPSVRYVDPSELTPEDSIGIVDVSDQVRDTAYVASSLRRNMFTWLPGYDDELADHYSYRRKVRKSPITSGETFSFYRANLERRYGQTEPESYVRKWEEVTLDRMQDWGFTSMGNWVDPAFYPNQKVPYFANGWIIGDFKTIKSEHDVWAPMPDPFDPEFVRRAEITINRIAEEIQGSPWCVGIFVDNEKSWGFPKGTVQQRYGVILAALALDAAQSPVKQAFTDYLQAKYEKVVALNKSWNTAFTSWDAIANGFELPDYTAGSEADFSMMLEMLSEEYFRVVHDTLETALPNHLYMGARMANWGMPAETIKASVKYSDVLSFNIYEEGIEPQAWSFLEDIDLPTVIGEFHIGATKETGLFHAGLVQADGQADRAEMYKTYMESVAAHNNMVGAHWFQYVDSPLTGRAFDGEPYNVGFVSNTDIPYPEMVQAAKEFNSALYPKRYGAK